MANRTKPRVLIVTQGTGRDRLLAGLVDGVEEVELMVVTLGPSHGPMMDQMESRGVPVESLGLDRVTLFSVPGAAVRLRKIFRRVRPTVVHSILFYASLSAELARRLSWKRPRVLLARHHNAIHHLEGRSLHVAIDGWIARRADRVVAVSDAVRRTLVRAECVPCNQVSVVYNGLDWDGTVQLAPDRCKAWADEYKGSRLLVAAGRLIPMKDHPTMLKALAKVVSLHPDVHLVIAGAGTEAARNRLLDLASCLGIGDHVEFPGWVPGIYELMSAAEVFVHSSFDESFCQVVVEAAGLGVPIATTTVGPLGDMIGSWHPQIDAYDDTRLAQRICQLLDDPVSARHEAATVADAVRKAYTMEAMAEGYAAAYRGLARADT